MDNETCSTYKMGFSSSEKDPETGSIMEPETSYSNEGPEVAFKTNGSCSHTAPQVPNRSTRLEDANEPLLCNASSNSRNPCSHPLITTVEGSGRRSKDGSVRNGELAESCCLAHCQSRAEAQDPPVLCDLVSKDEDVSSKSSFLQAALNGMNVLAGVGILSTPYALSQGGWLSLIFLVAFSVICLYTGILLRRCLDSNPAVNSYPDVGHAAFGWKGRALVSVLLYLELYCVTVEFLILEGDNLASLLPISGVGIGIWTFTQQQFYVVISALCMLPTIWLRNLRLLSYISAGGVLASVAIVSSVGYAGAFDGIGFHSNGTLINDRGLPLAVGVYAFCFCGHAVFPSIYGSMKCRQDFPKVLAVCFFLVTILYAGIGTMGYMMFGDEVESQVTLNLPMELLSSRIAIWITLVNPFAKFALTLTPIAVALEERLPWSQKSRQLVLWGTFIRTALVASTVAVALLVPFFGYMMALIGSFLSISVAIILPCMCYLKIFVARNLVSRGELCILVIILLIGLVTAFVGTYSAIQGIADSFHHFSSRRASV